MNEAIVTRELVKRYGRGCALDGLSLSVPAASVLGLVGRNGAGKTTWMMTVAGFVRPDSGTVNLLGRGPFDASRHSGRLGILPQDSELPLYARPRDLLVRYGRLQGLSSAAAAESADSLLSAFNLSEKARSPVRTLSHGMRKRVMVAQAFIGDPDVVLLDEPLSGLDPVEADRMRRFIVSRRGKQTIVISSHQLEDIERLCTHVAFVASGRLERIETLESLTSETGRLAYRLRREPAGVEAGSFDVEGLKLEWNAPEMTLTADFSPSVAAETVNERLLPSLFPFGVVSVSAGRSLEDAYLNR